MICNTLHGPFVQNFQMVSSEARQDVSTGSEAKSEFLGE
jgi:hypothetical protein